MCNVYTMMTAAVYSLEYILSDGKHKAYLGTLSVSIPINNCWQISSQLEASFLLKTSEKQVYGSLALS